MSQDKLGSKRKKVAEALAGLLADTFALYFKTHSYHWNVEGPTFHSLHLMFGGQYESLHTAVDELAERIRALGVKAPTSLTALLAPSSLTEDASVPDWKTMVANLIKGHERALKTAAEVHALAGKLGDEITVDQMIGRMDEHEKTLWMLRATLGS
jgi:starvation-inducible DNA-binding protein